MTHRGDLGEDGHRDFGRGLAADAQAHGAMQAREFGLRQIELGEPLAPLLGVDARAERTYIEAR